MPNPAITIDRLQTLEVALHFTAQIAFDRDLVGRDRVNDFVELLRGKIFRAQIRIDIGLIENALRDRSARSRKYKSATLRCVYLLEFQLLVIVA